MVLLFWGSKGSQHSGINWTEILRYRSNNLSNAVPISLQYNHLQDYCDGKTLAQVNRIQDNYKTTELESEKLRSCGLVYSSYIKPLVLIARANVADIPGCEIRSVLC